jgi:hypothetical protein
MFEYEALDLRLPPAPPRSRLFDLRPVGVGTPHVESLTGYASRLAETHCIRPAALFRELVIPAMNTYQEGKNGECFIGAGSGIVRAMNGIGGTAARVAEVMETFTSCKNLRFLTMLAWRDVVCHRHLIRRVRAWCPSCYEDGRGRGLVYESLQWSLSCVEVCDVHRRRLWSRCPHCQEQIPPLTSNTTPGLCSKCGRWLGSTRSDSDALGGLSDEDMDFHLGLVRDVGELLASAPVVEPLLCRNSVARALSLCTDRLAGGRVNRLAHLMNMQPSNIHRWKAGRGAPRLENLLVVSKTLGLSTLNFLTGEIASAKLSTEPAGEPASRREQCKERGEHSPVKINREEALMTLRDAETEDPPPSFAEVANRISGGKEAARPVGYRLRQRFPDVCRAICGRHAEHQRVQQLGHLREILEQALVESPPPSMNEVVERIIKLTGTNIFAARYKTLRHLCHEIAARHKNYKAEKRRAEHMKIREEVRHAASALYAENLYPTINKVRAFLHMTAELSHVGRAALIEIRKELGIQ